MKLIVFCVLLAVFTAQAFLIPIGPLDDCESTPIDEARYRLIGIHKILCDAESEVSVMLGDRLDEEQRTLVNKVGLACSELPNFIVDHEIKLGYGIHNVILRERTTRNISEKAKALVDSLIHNASTTAFEKITSCRNEALGASEAKFNELFSRDRELNDKIRKIEIDCTSCQSEDFKTCAEKGMEPVHATIIKYFNDVEQLRNKRFKVEVCYNDAQSEFDRSLGAAKSELLKYLDTEKGDSPKAAPSEIQPTVNNNNNTFKNISDSHTFPETGNDNSSCCSLPSETSIDKFIEVISEKLGVLLKNLDFGDETTKKVE